MIGLSPDTLDAVRRCFDPALQSEAESILIHECGNNLPLVAPSDERGLERIRFAVLKLSKGKIEELRRWVAVAQQDWREVLFGAGFENDLFRHEEWLMHLLAGWPPHMC